MNSPVFIVGVPRSGNTLVGCILNKHEALSIFFEFALFSAIRPKWYRRERLFGSVPPDKYVELFLRGKEDWYLDDTSLDVDPQELTRVVADAGPQWEDQTDALMSSLARKMGASRWGDKTPHNLREIPNIFREFPDARIVHVYRDPRHVVRSMSDPSFPPAPNHPVINAEIVRRYHTLYSEIRRDMNEAQKSKILDLKYESLLAEPEQSLRELLGFLGEDYTPKLLEPATASVRNAIGWKDYKGWGELEPQSSASSKPMSAAVELHLAEIRRKLDYPTYRTSSLAGHLGRLPAFAFRGASKVMGALWKAKYKDAHEFTLTYVPSLSDYGRWSLKYFQELAFSRTN